MQLRRVGGQLIGLIVLALALIWGLAWGGRWGGLAPLGRLVVQDGGLLVALLAVNHWWLRVPVFFRSPLTLANQFRVNTLPVIWMVILALGAAEIGAAGLWAMPVGVALGIAILVGCCEEYLFRGLTLGLCLRLFHPTTGPQIWGAVGLSSLLFGALHLINLTHQDLGLPLIQMLNAFALGALFAAVYLRTRSLLWPILAHAFNDFVAFLIMGLTPTTVGPTNKAAVIAVMAVVYLAVAAWLLRRARLTQVQANFVGKA